MNWPRPATWSIRRPLRRARCGALTLMQRLTCWIAAVLYATLAFGFSVPAEFLPVSSEVFPCMNHGCGCRSADQCWHDCCCMSLPEKLAWARENKVTPPEFVLAQARAQGLLEIKSAAASCCCCQAKPATTCCETKAASSCCKSKPAPHSSKSTAALAKSKRPAPGISLLAALKCRGAGDAWNGAPISLSPPPTLAAPNFGHLVAEAAEFVPQFTSWAVSPPTPPPRSAIS